MWRSWRPAVVLLVAAFTAAACSSGGTANPSGTSGGSAKAGTTITVMSLWGGSEQDAFQKVLDAFKAKTGITANFESVRQNYATTLQTRISGGNPPDIAIIPGIGFLRQFARQGSIKEVGSLGIDVSSIKGNYPPGILEVGQVDGKQYAIMVKFNSKSTMWYRPDKFKTLGVQPAKDWAGFTKLLGDIKAKGQAPLGLGAQDTWTLTDWFEELYLREIAGPEKYDQLFSGKLPWTDPSVAATVDAMKAALKEDNVAGGIKAALGRGFVDGIGQAFSANSAAVMYYEGGFVGGIATGQVNTALKIGDSIDWFDFPGKNATAVEIGGDVIAAFTNKPGVKEFMQYMTSADSGTVWAGTGAIISPIKSVPASAYPNDLAKREAAQVSGASAVRFDGSDLLPSGGGDDMGAALADAIQGKTVDWAKFESAIQAKWSAEKK